MKFMIDQCFQDSKEVSTEEVKEEMGEVVRAVVRVVVEREVAKVEQLKGKVMIADLLEKYSSESKFLPQCLLKSHYRNPKELYHCLILKLFLLLLLYS